MNSLKDSDFMVFSGTANSVSKPRAAVNPVYRIFGKAQRMMSNVSRPATHTVTVSDAV